jgi:Icc-related predicted phosphoesterase
MRIIALGDPHGRLPKNLSSIIKKKKIELIVCIGEVFPIIRSGNNAGDADLKSGEKILEKLNSYDIPVILFKGNMFFSKNWSKYFRQLIRKYKNIINKKLAKFKFKKKTFILFDMIYEKHSHYYLPSYRINESKNKKRLMRLNNILNKNKDAILLSHAPPYKCLDKIKSGGYIGSKILLIAIKKNHPKLVLCGHIHEAKGKSKIGKSEIYNLGCCGDYKIFKI